MVERGVAVIGLGYVGLPVALAFARKFSPVFGFDIRSERLTELRDGMDRTGEIAPGELRETSLILTGNARKLAEASLFIVAVPTPVDALRRPDLGALKSACETVGSVMRPASLVVFESTVHPGVTRDVCRPLLARASGLRPGVDFQVGYSPERINPGDSEHQFENLVKVVSGEDDEALERVASAYGAVVQAGIYKAPSLEVAEAAKVIENTQRDLNVAFMNELAMIFDRLRIRTADVLKAAATKWNFLAFSPGLVGGHCIGVDPYYLTAKAESVGYHPQIVLAGRRINDGMGAFVAQRVVRMLVAGDRTVRSARVAILGATFKENVRDVRNSRIPDIASELNAWGVTALIYDPLADSSQMRREYGIELAAEEDLTRLDGVILAVPHACLLRQTIWRVLDEVQSGGVVADVKSAMDPARLPPALHYWAL